MRYLLTCCLMFLTSITDFTANIAALTAHLYLLLGTVSISVISVIFLVRRMQSLQKEKNLIAAEQQLLIKELDQTVTALEDYKEAAFQQQDSMKRIAMVLSHDLQSPFRFLVSSTESLYQSIAKKDEGNAAILSLEIKKASEQMHLFLTDFTIWIKSISEGYQLKLEKVNLSDLFKKIDCFFSEQLNRKRNMLSYEIHADVSVITDKELLKIIVRNIVDNANKHNSECIIKLEVRMKEGNGMITISDNGKGMSAFVLEKINHTIHYNTESITQTDDKQGYKFIAHFTRLLNIKTTIYSDPAKGTCIQLEGLKIA
jgi:signal transduction histidine kinase